MYISEVGTRGGRRNGPSPTSQILAQYLPILYLWRQDLLLSVKKNVANFRGEKM